MNLKNIFILSLLTLHLNTYCQITDSINKADERGMKQGHWIKKYPNGHIQYNGYFKDSHPVGEFKRFFDTDTLQSILIFTPDGKEAEATLFHPNGYIASKGKFIDQLKEGKWKFFSAKINGYLICEEEYSKNIKNGISVKYYSDSSMAEKVSYINNLRNGDWIQYFPNHTICLKANYINGKLEGSFFVFFENGKPEYTGQYKGDTRDGTWIVNNSDGTLKYKIQYVDGVALDSEKSKKDSELLDALEKNKGKIADPAITGTIW